MDAVIEKMIEKLDSYKILNFLLPGIVFTFFAKEFLGIVITISGVVECFFLYYFIGFMISRIGSVVIEPILRKIKVVKFSSYDKFIVASEKDKKIELLSETNNMIRTLCALILLVIIVKVYSYIVLIFPILNQVTAELLLGIMLVLLILSYRKQASYITKRVNKQINNDNSMDQRTNISI